MGQRSRRVSRTAELQKLATSEQESSRSVSRTVWVEGIPDALSADPAALREIFSAFGAVESIDVRVRPSVAVNQAYVTFETTAASKRAILEEWLAVDAAQEDDSGARDVLHSPEPERGDSRASSRASAHAARATPVLHVVAMEAPEQQQVGSRGLQQQQLALYGRIAAAALALRSKARDLDRPQVRADPNGVRARARHLD